MLSIITLINITQKWTHLSEPSGIMLSSLLLISWLLGILNTQTWRKAIHYFFIRPVPIQWLGMVFTVFLVVLLLVFIALQTALNHYVPILATRLLNVNSDKINGYLLLGVWWWVWLPLAAGAIAYVARGHSIRFIVSSVLLLPILLSLFTWLVIKQDVTVHWSQLWTTVTILPATLIVTFLFLRGSYITCFVRAALPETTMLKKRNPTIFLTGLLQMSIVLTLFYWLTSINGLTGVLFVLLFPLTILLAIGGVALFKELSKKKI